MKPWLHDKLKWNIIIDRINKKEGFLKYIIGNDGYIMILKKGYYAFECTSACDKNVFINDYLYGMPINVDLSNDKGE